MLAIIPARSGSKRLPGKNIRLLRGKPLIAYTIEAALKSNCITKVIVSTDSQEIADIAIKCGAEVLGLRPDYLSTDAASSNDVIKYTLTLSENYFKQRYDECILLQPTSPLRESRHIDEAIALFKGNDADAVISFTEESHPLKWNKHINKDGIIEQLDYFEDRPTYFPNGAIYILKKEAILSANYYTDRTYAYLMDRNVSFDIDTIDDWNYVEYLLNMFN